MSMPATHSAKVASRAEAWIETKTMNDIWQDALVASRAEAWIETLD